MPIQEFKEAIKGMTKKEGYAYFITLVKEGKLNGINATDEHLPAVQALPNGD